MNLKSGSVGLHSLNTGQRDMTPPFAILATCDPSRSALEAWPQPVNAFARVPSKSLSSITKEPFGVLHRLENRHDPGAGLSGPTRSDFKGRRAGVAPLRVVK